MLQRYHMESHHTRSKNHKLSTIHWETMIPDALHSIRTLISVSANCTSHERLFQYQRWSSTRCNFPGWLSTPGQVLLKKHFRKSKYNPLIEEVKLIETNSQYAHIRYPNGKETTVSVRHLALKSDDYKELNSEQWYAWAKYRWTKFYTPWCIWG